MKCKIDGCGSDAAYKEKQVCQKHYFRFMRTGSYEIVKRYVREGVATNRKYRSTHSSGYQVLYEPDHCLSNSKGYIYEHRKVIYEKYGESIPDCEMCGKATSWEPYTTHIDHINRDKSDNSIDNLRVLCNGCNSSRDRNYALVDGIFVIEIDGVSKTAYQWAATPGATHAGGSIKRRIADGLSPRDAVFGINMTHGKKKQEDKLSVTKSLFNKIND